MISDRMIGITAYRCVARPLLACLVLTACGGGGSATSTSSGSSASGTLNASGAAATGAAITGGSVSVVCQGGSGTATTAADGTYSVSIPGASAPCLVQVTTADGGTTFYSALPAGETVANVSPVTHLVVAAALGTDPSGTSFTPSASMANGVTASSVATAKTYVASVMTSLGATLPSTTDVLSGSYRPATDVSSGDAVDIAVDNLMAKTAMAGATVGSLSSVVASSTSAGLAASSAASTIVTNTGMPTTNLASCPYLPAGKYWLAVFNGDGSGSNLRSLTVNFNSDGSPIAATIADADGVSNTDTATISTSTDGNGNVAPCQFNVRSSDGSMHAFQISKSGLAFGGTPFSYPSGLASGFVNATTTGQNSFLVLPAQPVPFSALTGTWYVASYGAINRSTSRSGGTTTPGKWYNSFSMVVIDGAARTFTVTPCVTQTLMSAGRRGLDCSGNVAFGSTSGTVSKSATGQFQLTTSEATLNLAVYKSPNGDMIAVSNTAALGTNPYDSASFSIAAKRVAPFPTRAVGDKWTNFSWQVQSVFSNGNFTLGNQPFVKTYAVTALAAPNADKTQVRLTRKDDVTVNANNGGWANSTTDTFWYNLPYAGLIWRPFAAQVGVGAGVTNPQINEWVGITGLGWSVTGSTYAANGKPSFFNISVNGIN